ncbi:hypothetical protein GLA29479_3008 [Lysobacter antibioticus]|nr:hypothetical protein GLA29479_3008 [Lysobacter antibioticus]
MRAVFHRDRDVPYEKALRWQRSCGPVIQKEAFFFGYALSNLKRITHP